MAGHAILMARAAIIRLVHYPNVSTSDTDAIADLAVELVRTCLHLECRCGYETRPAVGRVNSHETGDAGQGFVVGEREETVDGRCSQRLTREGGGRMHGGATLVQMRG
ncbi:hypothetical protein BHE74_00050430 [Ensete ventricosum]|nr:hypothetical protein BHE74_00050430 [Ensete ventricosum]RZR88001.1 hypothetical protein BHM03_00015485 [Ensete ventricosum]